MTEGEFNMMAQLVEGRLAKAADTRHERLAVVAPEWLASVLVENERLRQQVTEVQAHNTALQERARAVKAMLDTVVGAATELERERDEARSALATETANANEYARQRDGAHKALASVTRTDEQQTDYLAKVLGADIGGLESVGQAAKRVVRERDELRGAVAARDVALGDVTKRLAETGADLARVTKELGAERAARKHEEHQHAVTREQRDLSCGVPPELARLYKAARTSLSMHGTAAQMSKLAEESGEYVAEFSRLRPRYDAARVRAEAHDVLTVALSLCEPALMAASAERLEGRLA